VLKVLKAQGQLDLLGPKVLLGRKDYSDQLVQPDRKVPQAM
jgi:hypothetical protein